MGFCSGGGCFFWLFFWLRVVCFRSPAFFSLVSFFFLKSKRVIIYIIIIIINNLGDRFKERGFWGLIFCAPGIRWYLYKVIVSVIVVTYSFSTRYKSRFIEFRGYFGADFCVRW